MPCPRNADASSRYPNLRRISLKPKSSFGYDRPRSIQPLLSATIGFTLPESQQTPVSTQRTRIEQDTHRLDNRLQSATPDTALVGDPGQEHPSLPDASHYSRGIRRLFLERLRWLKVSSDHLGKVSSFMAQRWPQQSIGMTVLGQSMRT